ncbi:hypothetical protein MJQ72_35580 [Amycolatopsis sp. EV170708-02-1]|nr:hypothetical protein MJQ72_35580 [Amycolatopsis sp. EV170708-02-1]
MSSTEIRTGSARPVSPSSSPSRTSARGGSTRSTVSTAAGVSTVIPPSQTVARFPFADAPSQEWIASRPTAK